MSERGPTLSIKEAAARLGVSPKTLRRWTDRGLIAHVRLPNGYRRFRPEDLDAAVREIPAVDSAPVVGTAHKNGREEDR